jgi:hypothetical protein
VNSGDRIDLSLKEHLLLQARRQLRDADLAIVDAVLLDQQRQQLERSAAL